MKRKGLTLIEILLSVAIISVSAIVILRVFVSSGVINERTKYHDLAVFEAVTLMERIDYEDLSFLFDSPYDGRGLDFIQGFKEAQSRTPLLSFIREDDNGLRTDLKMIPKNGEIDVEIVISKSGEHIFDLKRTFYRRLK